MARRRNTPPDDQEAILEGFEATARRGPEAAAEWLRDNGSALTEQSWQQVVQYMAAESRSSSNSNGWLASIDVAAEVKSGSYATTTNTPIPPPSGPVIGPPNRDGSGPYNAPSMPTAPQSEQPGRGVNSSSGGTTPEQMTLLILERETDPTIATTWLQNNGDTLSQEAWTRAIQIIQGKATLGGAATNGWGEVANLALVMQDEVLGPANVPASQTESAVLDNAAKIAAASLDATGVVDAQAIRESAPDWYTPQMVDGLIEDAKGEAARVTEQSITDHLVAGGMDPAEAAREATRRLAALGYVETVDPDWIMAANGAELSTLQRSRIVSYWNDLHGTNFRNYNQVANFLQDSSMSNQNLVAGALADQEPITKRTISIPFVDGAKDVDLTEDEVGTLMTDFGLSADGVTRLVRLANLQGDATGFQNIAGLAALSRFNGQGLDRSDPLSRIYSAGDELARFNQTQQDIEQTEARLKELDRGEGPQYGPARAGLRHALTTKLESLRRQNARREESGNTVGLIRMQNMYERGLNKFGADQGGLAYLYALDPELAGRIAETGGDPAKLTGGDNARALNLLDRGGLTTRGKTSFEKLGGNLDNNVLQYIGGYFDRNPQESGGGGGGGGPVRRVLDTVGVADQVRQLWQGMFRSEPSDELIAAFAKELQGQLDRSPQGMDFDVSARINDWVKGQPQYNDLYGKKVDGVTEQEYQGQFVGAAQSMMGGEMPDEGAIEQGMRTGDYQTTIGAVAGSAKAWQNSKFLGRLAEAAQQVSALT